jgi:hypothetical protein
MSRAQWVLEFHALQAKERLWFGILVKGLRQTLVSVLGLNAIRPEDEHGSPKDWQAMTEEERQAFIPLVAWVGRPELLKTVTDQQQAEIDPDKIMGDKSYEEIVQSIDKLDGDMTPILKNLHGIDPDTIPTKPIAHQQLDIKTADEMKVDLENL